VGRDPFLHLVGDHLYVSHEARSCAQQLVAAAEANSAPYPLSRRRARHLLPYYGAIGGRRLQGQPGLYEVETVIEKPTPTVAEQRLIVSGLRAGHYLCFFGMHVLTQTVMEILGELIEARSSDGLVNVTLADALAQLSRARALPGT
jgi:UTP--glucose-1-phosphate uridylyltransferase